MKARKLSEWECMPLLRCGRCLMFWSVQQYHRDGRNRIATSDHVPQVGIRQAHCSHKRHHVTIGQSSFGLRPGIHTDNITEIGKAPPNPEDTGGKDRPPVLQVSQRQVARVRPYGALLASERNMVTGTFWYEPLLTLHVLCLTISPAHQPRSFVPLLHITRTTSLRYRT
jgi:hypothetical protein